MEIAEKRSEGEEAEGQDFDFNKPSIPLEREHQEIEDLKSDRQLREMYAKWIIGGLGVEICLAFAFVGFAGVGWFKLEEWLVALLFESTLVQSFVAFVYVLKYLFRN
ncbi:MAG: hypothetical protein L3V56_11720 [Candidatus Magnetoovum sp. WYHC-5]|nr:hypothetical protein [Candidatus Magnetoovum sp. WYHC-5]